MLRTKRSVPSAPAFHVSDWSLSYFSAWDRYRENKVLEESVNEEPNPDVGAKILLVPLWLAVDSESPVDMSFWPPLGTRGDDVYGPKSSVTVRHYNAPSFILFFR